MGKKGVGSFKKVDYRCIAYYDGGGGLGRRRLRTAPQKEVFGRDGTKKGKGLPTRSHTVGSHVGRSASGEREEMGNDFCCSYEHKYNGSTGV